MATRRRPGFFTRLRAGVNVFRHGYPQSRYPTPSRKKLPFIWPAFREGQAQYHVTDFNSYVSHGFSLNALVYEAVMYKARAVSQAPLRAYKGDPDQPEGLPPESPLASLIARPNMHQSQAEFMQQAIVYLNLDGNCYIFCEPGGELPKSFSALRPDRVFVIAGSARVQKAAVWVDASTEKKVLVKPLRECKAVRGVVKIGYVYVPEGKSLREGVPILAQDMAHVKLPNPGDPLEGMGYGLAPLGPAARSADVDNMVTDFLNIFFQKGVLVPGILSTDVAIDDTTAEELKERWKEMYGGYENWGEEIAVLGEGATYQRVGLTFDEMGFDELDKRNEGRVCGPFGVPVTLLPTRLGAQTSTYENKKLDRLMVWEDVLVPELGLFEDEFQYHLQSGNEFVQYDLSKVPALEEKRAEKRLASLEAFKAGGITRAQFKLAWGLDPEPGDDVYLVPFSSVVTPVGQLKPPAPKPDEGEPTPSAEEDEEERGKKAQPPVRPGG